MGQKNTFTKCRIHVKIYRNGINVRFEKRFFIIGNGFDLHHGIPTSYEDFRNHTLREYPKGYELINKSLLNTDEDNVMQIWGDLETSLSRTTVHYLPDLYQNCIRGYDKCVDNGADPIDCAKKIREPYVLLMELLEKWACSIRIESYKKLNFINFTKNDRIMTFNYTETVEKLYNCSKKRVFHIHGKVGDRLSFGHDTNWNTYLPLDRLPVFEGDTLENATLSYRCNETYDPILEETKQILMSIPNILYKDTKEIADQSSGFLKHISNSDALFILGWSVSKIDRPYLEEALSYARQEMPIYYVGYTQETLDNFVTIMEECGFGNLPYRTLLWTELNGFTMYGGK